MSTATHQMFGYFNNKYYAVDELKSLIIPENADYESSLLSSQENVTTKECNIDIYRYHSDLTTDCNTQRVVNMKDFLIDQHVIEIEKTSGQLIIGVDFVLYNKDGHILKAGVMEGMACGYTPSIIKPVKKNNLMEYHKSILAHSFIEIPIPQISRYGIVNAFDQHPYTLKIKGIRLSTTVGGYKYFEANSQIDNSGCAEECYEYHFFNSASHICTHNPLIHNNFACHFITDAPAGQTIIGSMVTSKVLESPEEYTQVTMIDLPMDEKNYSFHIKSNVNVIKLNIEVMLDNFNIVYDTEDIKSLLKGIMEGDVTPIPPQTSENEDEGGGPNPDPNENEEENNSEEEETPENTEPPVEEETTGSEESSEESSGEDPEEDFG